MTAHKEYGLPYEITPHSPVMLNEVIEYLSIRDGGTYVDGTFGAGGHTKAILERADCRVFSIDRDPYVERFALKLQEEYGDRISLLNGRFSEMKELLEERGIEHVDGILLDVGVSSMQIDTPRRGFSFDKDGPLDMRMGNDGNSAADLVNSASEEELAGIIFKYGGERMSRRIAKSIIAARVDGDITRTGKLSEIIRKAVGKYNDTINPATRTFQALRIWVNDELEELEEALEAAQDLLSPNGRLVVITFHSGEDSIVKHFLNERSGKTEGYSRHQPVIPTPKTKPTFRLVERKAIKPFAEEISTNKRARSAKMRIAERTAYKCFNSETKSRGIS